MGKKIEKDLNKLLEGEEEKLLQAIKNKVSEEQTRGISQTIGRRLGYFWEEICRIILQYSIDEVYPDDIILDLDVMLDMLNNEFNLSQNELEAIKEVLDYLNSFDVIRYGEELADIAFFKNNISAGLQIKWRFRSNDAKTVRQIANAANLLEELDHKPIMLIKRPFEDSFEAPLNRFARHGWDIKCDKEAVNFIEKISNFPLESWIEQNVDFWNLLRKEQDYLNSIGWDKKQLTF